MLYRTHYSETDSLVCTSKLSLISAQSCKVLPSIQSNLGFRVWASDTWNRGHTSKPAIRGQPEQWPSPKLKVLCL